MITRDNYEEFFLLYIDNELSMTERSAVEDFVAANPDLQEEWETLLQCRVHPDRHEAFPDKELLLRMDLVSYIDGELDEAGRKAVEEFVTQYPSKAVELQQLSMTVSQPDLSIVFPDKESLYRNERRFIFIPWMQAGIAAAVLGIVALLILSSRHNPVEPNRLVHNNTPNKNAPAAVTTATPAPLHSQGSDDQRQPDGTAKNDPQPRTGTRKTEQQALVKKEKANVAIGQQEVATTTTARSASIKANASTTVVAVTTVNPPVDATVAEVRPDEKTLIKPTDAVTAVNIPKEQSSFATQALMEEAQADESKEMLTAAPAGKSKLRGLFRKVSRTFGKTAERDNDGQKEVLISAFQVELK